MKRQRRNKKGQFARSKIDWFEFTILLVVWGAVIVVAEKVKWIAGKEWGSPVLVVSAAATIGIIVSEFVKYIAVRHIRKLFGKKNGG